MTLATGKYAVRKSFPLQWPEGWRRTEPRDRKTQRAMREAFSRDRDEILSRLNRRGASAVITSDLPLRSDGLPYANSRCEDPAIAVYWIELGSDSKWHERVLACDHWTTIGHNMRAMNLTIDAICGIDRWGCTEIIERAFAGFTALPAAGDTFSRRRWRDIFNMEEASVLGVDDQLLIAKARYRDLMKVAHPDHGGSAESASEITRAMEDAEAELTKRVG